MVPVMHGLIAQQLRWQELIADDGRGRGGHHRDEESAIEMTSDEGSVESSETSSQEEEEEVGMVMLRLPRARLFPREMEEAVPTAASKAGGRKLLYPDDPPNYTELLLTNTRNPHTNERLSPVSTSIPFTRIHEFEP